MSPMRHYIALIYKDADSDYGVSFPDLPGCVTAGTTLDEAKAFAEDGEAVPDPSSLETVMAERENRDGVAVLVAAKGPAARAVRINITMPEDILARVDSYAERHGMNRSGFLVHAAKREMKEA